MNCMLTKGGHVIVGQWRKDYPSLIAGLDIVLPAGEPVRVIASLPYREPKEHWQPYLCEVRGGLSWISAEELSPMPRYLKGGAA